MIFLAALTEQVESGQIIIESLETTQNDEAGHVTVHWLRLPRPETRRVSATYDPREDRGR